MVRRQSRIVPVYVNNEPINGESKCEEQDVLREPNRFCTDDNDAGCDVSIHPLSSKKGLIVRVTPPTEPLDKVEDHVPGDYVLSIDVSGSMSAAAPIPPLNEGEKPEETGLTVLDLTKHAAKTVVRCLDKHDRLAIVSFDSRAQLLLAFTSMTPENKNRAEEIIEQMQPGGATDLWGGVTVGLEQFEEIIDHPEKEVENVKALLLLTDGRPEGHNDPPMGGWLKALRDLGKPPATIHTFGFGYNLKPGLLHSIAEVGGGNHAFIAGENMLGTTFINAVANLQSTFAQRAVLKVQYPSFLRLTDDRFYINEEQTVPVNGHKRGNVSETTYTMELHNIRYGQPRHIYLKYGCRPDELETTAYGDSPLYVQACLDYHDRTAPCRKLATWNLGHDVPMLPANDEAWHVSRTEVLNWALALYPVDKQDGRKPVLDRRIPSPDKLCAFVQGLPAYLPEHRNDPRNAALLEDLIGNDTSVGEVKMALDQTAPASGGRSSYLKWGRFYLASFAGGHLAETRLNYKDESTQHYIADSPLFKERHAVLENTFNRSPPPKPTGCLPSSYNASAAARVDMGVTYNNPARVCFAGHTQVLLSSSTGRCSNDGARTIAIKDLRPGMTVQTLRGARTVRTVLNCHTDPTDGRMMCAMPTNNGATLMVTPWHPVSLDNGRTWVYPAEQFPPDGYPEARVTGFRQPVYSVMLVREADTDHPDAHSINVGGVWGVTMGHGLVDITAKKDDIRHHMWWGDYDAVAAGLDKLGLAPDGLVYGYGTTLDEHGESNGFVDKKTFEAAKLLKHAEFDSGSRVVSMHPEAVPSCVHAQA